MMLSIILPVYNERENLSVNLPLIKDALDGTADEYEIIIAEDGSSDGTASLASDIASSDKRILLSHSQKRLGKGLAIKSALSLANGDSIGFMDIDLSSDPSLTGTMLGRLRTHDIVIGSRLIHGSSGKRRLSRHLFSLAYNSMIRLVFRTGIRDHQCGFKFFRRSVFLGLAREARNDRWFFDSEVLILARRKGLSVREVPVRWRDARKTKVGQWVVIHMLADMMRFLLKQK